LLKCLIAWSGLELEPYGIDRRPDAIATARELFGAGPERFAVAEIWSTPLLGETALPRTYDHVLFGVFDDMTLTSAAELELLAQLRGLVAADGRLILSFYGPDPEGIRERMERAGALWEGPAGEVTTAGGGVAAMWFDASPAGRRAATVWEARRRTVAPALAGYAAAQDAEAIRAALRDYSDSPALLDDFAALVLGRASRVERETRSAVEVLSMLCICREHGLAFDVEERDGGWRFAASA
jgi:hypothetical protein